MLQGHAQRGVKTFPVSWVSEESSTVLSKAGSPGVNVCVWRRTLSSALDRWLRMSASDWQLDAHAIVSNGLGVAEALLGHRADCAELRVWREDIAELTRLFLAITKATALKASLVTVVSDKCRKFHVDYKPLRLVCTYVGPGTEWAEDAAVNRAAMGHEESCFDTANARIVQQPDRIERARAGDVVVLKGERFPGNQGRGGVHRSPPIEHIMARRIVFTLDPA